MFPAVPGTPRRKKSGAAQESAFPPRPDSADIADFAFSSRPGTKEGDRSRPGTSGSFGTDLDSEYDETSRPGTNEGYRDRLTSAGFSRPGTSGSLATVNSEFDDFRRPGQLHDDFKNMFHHSDRPMTADSEEESLYYDDFPRTEEDGKHYHAVHDSRPSTCADQESRPGTRDGALDGRPHTADSEFEQFTSRPDTSGSLPAAAGSDSMFSRPATRESVAATESNLNMDHHIHTKYGTGHNIGDVYYRPRTSEEFRRRPRTADEEEFEFRPGTSETFRRPTTAEEYFRPDTADTYARPYSAASVTSESMDKTRSVPRPQTAAMAREPSMRATIKPGIRQPRPQTSIRRDDGEPLPLSIPKKLRPSTHVDSRVGQKTEEHEKSSPVRRPMTAMVREESRSFRKIDYRAPGKVSDPANYVRPRTAKLPPPARRSGKTVAVTTSDTPPPSRQLSRKESKRTESARVRIVITNSKQKKDLQLPKQLPKKQSPEVKKVDMRASNFLGDADRLGAFGSRPYNLTEEQKQLVKEMTAIGKTVKRKAAKLRNVASLRISREPYFVKSAADLYDDITRPLTAASVKTEQSRPTSPKPMVPYPRGGKVLPRPVTASILAEKQKEVDDDENRNPWEVNLHANVAKPRTAAVAVAPPTDAIRRPWVPEGQELPDSWVKPNARPWSTDKTLVKGGVNRGEILLADGRPHTVGSLPAPKKILTYNEAFAVTRSHADARKMMKMQAVLVKEDNVRMYEDWQLDAGDLALQKRNVRSWGTNGGGITDNPVVRAIANTIADTGKREKSKKTKTIRPNTVTGATGKAADRRKREYKSKDEEVYHKAMLNSFRTNELEILWQGLKIIPRNVAFNTLLLSMQHLRAVRLSGNKLENIPSWFFTTMHCTVELNLGNNRLRVLPEALGMMHQLISFECPQNRITRLPESFTKLTNLTSLKLAGNGLSLLPKRVGHLFKLRVLRLEDNNLTTLPGDFQKLIKLSDLCLSRNRIGTLALITPLNPPVKRVDKMEDWTREDMGELGVLWRNEVTGQCSRWKPKPPPAEEVIDENTKLDLSKVKAGDHETLESAFDGLTNLQKRDRLGAEGRGIFDIRFDPIEGFPFFIHNLTHEKTQEMPPELDLFGRVGNIKRLVLSFNVLHHLPNSLGKLKYLLELILDHNKLTVLPPSLKGLMNLRTLSVVNNRLEHLPKELRHLRKLDRLAVNYNKLVDVPSELGELTQLKRLWISNNFIEEIPPHYYTLTNLVQLYAGDNPWKVPPVKVVRDGIEHVLRDCRERWARYRRGGRPPEVETVSLGILSEVVVPQPRYMTTLKNAFKHAWKTNELRLQWLQLQDLPQEIYEMKDLVDLGLMCNLLTAIPVTLCRKVNHLTSLNMYNNKLTHIPDAISSLKLLEVLNVERNHISQISGRICFLNKLRVLRLTGNRVKELPAKFHKLKALEELYADVNFIIKLPAGIVDLPRLKLLILMKNKLKKFPPGIEKLKRLKILNLNQNLLSKFPDGIDSLPALKELSLSHNAVKTMDITFGMGALTTTLEKLWLYGNKLVELPHTFRFLTALKDIRIEHNPMRSPPPELSLLGTDRIREYLEDRIRRTDEIKKILTLQQLRFTPANLTPVSEKVLVRSSSQAAATTAGYLTEEDLAFVDTMVDHSINANYYDYDTTNQEIVDWIIEKKEFRRHEFQKNLLNRFLIWVEWGTMETDEGGKLEKSQPPLLTDDIFRPDMTRRWGEEQQGERHIEPVYAFITASLFRQDGWKPEDDGLEVLLDPMGRRIYHLGDDEVVYKSIIERGNDRIDRENERRELKKLLKPEYIFEHVPRFENSEFQLLEACEMFQGPYGPVASVETGVKFQLDAAGRARAKVRAKERLEKMREIERKKKHKIKLQNQKAQGIVANKEEESKEAAAEEEEEEEAEEMVEDDVLTKKNDALILLQTIYTLEEVKRKFREEQRLNRETQQAREDVDRWFVTVQGKKMVKLEYKKRKKYGLDRVVAVRRAIKKAAKEVKEASKEYKYVMERSNAYDANPGAYEAHRFNTPDERDKLVQDADMGMKILTDAVEKYKENLVEVTLLSKRKKLEIEEELLAELLEKYATLAYDKVIDDGRVYAFERELRRPWDGRNGRKFKAWVQEKNDLMNLITQGGGDDTDSDESTGNTPRDIFGFKKKVDPLETKFVWDKYVDPLEKEMIEEAKRAKAARRKAKEERRALALAAGEDFDESSSEDDDDADDESDAGLED